MTDVLRLSWSIAQSGWRASWNRSFRFSKMKTAAIWLVLQALFFFMIARRAPAMAAGAAGQGLGGLFVLMGLQMAWFGMMYGFSRGQFQLYQGILVPLFQISPARPLAFLLGRVIEAVPTRAWSCLLWAWAYSSAIPGSARWGALASLALFGLAVAMAAHLSGLLLLTFWSRYSPKTMRNGLFLFGGLTLALVTWAIIFISSGHTVTELALIMRQYRVTAFGFIAVLGGVPGLLLLTMLLARPESVENLYRQGLYQVIELGESDVSRPGRSIWLPLGDGVLRAVLSREWLELGRSRIARVQLMIWVAGTVGVLFAGRAMAGQPMERVIQYIGALSLFAWFMAYGHWVVRVFEKERKTVLLYRLAAVPTSRLLLAKFISVTGPSAVLVAISTLVGSLAAGLNGTETLTVMAWSLGALTAGTFGGFGMSAATAGEEPEEQEVDAAPRRDGETPQATGNAWWSLARTVALVVTTALPIYTGAGLPGLPFAVPGIVLFALNVLLPTGVLVAGVWLMVRIWERNA